MKFKITAASLLWDLDKGKCLKKIYGEELKNFPIEYKEKYGEIEINSLEELIYLMKIVDEELIISLNKNDFCSIEIYDDYIE